MLSIVLAPSRGSPKADESRAVHSIQAEAATKLMCNVCDGRGVEAEADHLKDPRRVTRRTHARFTDFRMDWRSVCCGIDDSCWTVCGDIDGSCWTVCAGIGGSRGGVLCAINCFGAPLVGARGFLGFRPLLFGIEREPAAPAGSTFFTFTEYAAPFGWIKTTPPRNGTSIG